MSRLLMVKVRRDLRATWPRLVLMVVAIAVGLTAFGAVLYAWSTIGRETERAYLSTGPASATIRFGPGVDTGEMAAIAAQARTRPGVIDATGRTQFTSDVAANDSPAREIPLQVYVAAPDDPMRMAKAEVRQGSWPPSPEEIFVRPDALDLLGIAVGDTVAIETPDGTPARLRVAGTVYDPSLAAGSQQQTANGYLSTAALAALGEPDVLDQLKIQVTDPGQAAPSRDRDAIVAVASEVSEWLEREHGLRVLEVQVPEPYAHPHQGQADTLLTALLIGAGGALLLATILVANMLNNLFTRQIPQIGIMKAIGARSGRIGRLYLAMTLLVTGAACLLALAPGILIGRAFAPVVFGFLGVEAGSLTAAWWTYLVVVAAGLVLPVLLALVPIVKASRTTVRAAIDHHGGGAKPGAAAAVLARLSRVHRINRGLLMALRNTVRRPARFWLSVGLLAGAGTMFVAGLSVRAGSAAVADEVTDKIRWDVVVRLANSTSVDALAPVVQRVPNVSRVEGWTVTTAGVSGPARLPLTATYPDQGHGGVSVTAIPADTTMLAPPKLLEGRWLNPGETGAIVLNQIARADTIPGVRSGDTVELSIAGEPTTWRVVGIIEERGDAGDGYVTAEGLAATLGAPRWSNTLRIATDRHDERTRQAVADAVGNTLTAAGVEVRAAESVGRQETAAGGHLEPILVLLLATALPMGVIGCVGLASTMGANVLERIREFGVLHAIGARPRTVRRIVVAEGAFIALASCLLAILPALGLTAAMGSVLGNLFSNAPVPFRISTLAIAVWTVLAVLGAMLASNAAATRASRLTVREALAYL